MVYRTMYRFFAVVALAVLPGTHALADLPPTFGDAHEIPPYVLMHGDVLTRSDTAAAMVDPGA